MRRDPIVTRAAWLGTALALIAAVPPPSPRAALGAPQVVRVQQARLASAPSAHEDTGALLVNAIIDDSAAGGAFEAALLDQNVSIMIRDSGGFEVNVRVSACRLQPTGATIRCASADGSTYVRVKRTSPSVYSVRLFRRRLSQAVTGKLPPRSPVTVSFHRPGRADDVDIISDCFQRDGRVLACRDQNRPNIVFLVTDDQRWDTLSHMPRTLDELAARGVRFTNAFVTTPLCSPSRVSMLTGQHTHHHGVLNNDPPYGGVTRFNDASTLATWLQRRGYRTGMYGKYLADYRRLCRAAAQCYVPPGWDDWHVFLQQKYYGYQLVENGQVNSYGTGPADYSTDVLASKAVEFIMNAHGQPFFLHVGFHAPHGDAGGKAKPAPRHLNTLIDIAPWRPTSYDEDDTTDKPPWLPQIRASDLINPLLPYGVWTDEIRRSQLEALLAVDEAIESLMAALDATGQSDNTVVVFTSDNGYLWGEHRLFFGKDYPYEESLRVPLIIRDPRLVGAPRTETRLALNIDLAPTLAELAGVNPTTAVDGMSLVPLLRDPAAPWRSDFLFEWGRLSAPPRAGLPPYVGVRSERFKYCSYPTVGLAELYDLTTDADELHDLSSDPTYESVRAELQSHLDQYLAQTP